jgi:hypothetical protein
MATIEDLLESYTPEVCELAEALRTRIFSLVPQVREKVYMGWKGLGYHHPQQGYFCAIFPQTDHVRLAFEHGVDLHDPDGLLEGTGTQVRYIPIFSVDDIESDAVAVLILQASG